MNQLPDLVVEGTLGPCPRGPEKPDRPTIAGAGPLTDDMVQHGQDRRDADTGGKQHSRTAPLHCVDDETTARRHNIDLVSGLQTVQQPRAPALPLDAEPVEFFRGRA